MSKTAILVPSLGRAQHVKRVFGNIEANTPEPHAQFWLVAGDDYQHELSGLGMTPEGGLKSEDTKGYWALDTLDPDKRYVTRMNKLSKWAVELGFDYMFFGSDDVVHHPGWLAQALDVMEQAEKASVVVVNDLRNPNGTQALIRTSYLPLAVFDDPSAAFHHGYQHNFADTELFQTAAERGVIYRAKESHVEHLHPLHQGSNQREWDETYAYAQSQWSVDAKLFNERMIAMKESLS